MITCKAQGEMARALEFEKVYGKAPLENAALLRLFQVYSNLIAETDSMMMEKGVSDACARCAAVTGSCCFAGMYDGYGAMSFYVNLLMGSDFSENGRNDGSCRFVGTKGCGLKARHSFCLNYFCPQLNDSLGERAIRDLTASVGRQLQAGWELECALTKWMAGTTRLG